VWRVREPASDQRLADHWRREGDSGEVWERVSMRWWLRSQRERKRRDRVVERRRGRWRGRRGMGVGREGWEKVPRVVGSDNAQHSTLIAQY
jgi:hypothetical protein